MALPWGRVSWGMRVGAGIKRSLLVAGPVTVRFRRGGERLRPHGHTHSRTLKHLLQDWRVPPWERPYLPLLYVGDTLAAVPGHCVVTGYAAAAGEAGMMPVWECGL